VAPLTLRRPAWFRHQLPVHSPLPMGAVLPAVAAWLRPGADPRLRLAEELRAHYGANACVPCGSGTQALQLALRLALRGVESDARVALPAFSCYDLAAAAVHAGQPVLLYDLDPDTLAPDPDALERTLRAGARVVVAAPLYGMPLDWQALRTQCDAHGALLIEDAAQGAGADWQGRPLGAWGDLSVLSFGRGKGWTGGRGGALLLRGGFADALMEAQPAPGGAHAEASALAGAAAQNLLGRPALYGVPMSIPWLRLGETVYHPPRPVVTLPRAAAAMLLATRGAAEREAGARRHNAAVLLAGLEPRQGVRTVQPLPGGEPGYLRLPLRLDAGLAGFADPGAALRLGIAPSYPQPLSALPPLRTLLADRTDLPGSLELARTLITLPTHSLLTRGERAEVLRLVNTYGSAGWINLAGRCYVS
jgi:perosamine synthetase